MKQHIPRVAAIGSCLVVLASLCAASTGENQTPFPELLSLAVEIVDPEGQPVSGAQLVPWALRSSQGHGQWSKDGQGGSEPAEYVTDADGCAKVFYPRYSYADERVRVLDVTLSIDHADFAYISHEIVHVPQEGSGPHIVTLARGATVEVMPILEGRPAELDQVFLLWSDSRSWKPGVSLSRTEAGGMRIPTMSAGAGEVIAVRLEGERATHFSPIAPLDLTVGEPARVTAELTPAARIVGKLSENVPRPVQNGRVSARTIPREAKGDHVNWISWAPIAADGTFEIESWPATEDAQIIALCDGFSAESGQAPAVASPPPVVDGFSRPQVFASTALAKSIELKMTPLVTCQVEVTDPQGQPLKGIKIRSYPNVGWWNVGSQIYCTPLARSERLLRKRKFEAGVGRDTPFPFEAMTNSAGRATLYVPAGREDLTIESDDYELPINVGRREQRVTLVAGEITEARLVLQPKGTEHLGDWDKLAGVLFGCRGEECRRLLEDQGFRRKMSKVSELLDSASNPRDPAVLQRAYSEISRGFDELKDQEEADRWRKKSEEQAARLNLPPAKAGDSK